MFKADVFMPRGDAWSYEELSRARVEKVDTPGGSASIRFASPEDTLLHKLVRYRLGNEVSDRQWGDILGVLKVQSGVIDLECLDLWAKLDVSDLLQRARQDPF